MGGPALALDAEAFLSALNRPGLGTSQVEFKADATRVEGDAIVLDGLTLTSLADGEPIPGVQPLRLGTVTFENVREEGADGYRYDRAVGEPLSGTFEVEPGGPEASWSFDGYELINGYLPPSDAPEEERRFMAAGGYYDRFTFGAAEFVLPDAPAFTIAGGSGSYDWNADPVTFDARIEDFAFDLTSVPSPDAGAAAFIERTGYERIVFDMIMDGTFDLDEGAFEFGYELPFERMGTLGFRFALDGLVPERLADVNEALTASGSTDPAEVERSLTALETAAGPIELVSVSITYRDDGFTNTILDFAAEQTGTPREQLVSTATGSLPIGLGAIGAGSLVAPAYTAASTFFSSPGTLRIAAEPAEPVTVESIVAAARTNPTSIPELIGLTIEGSAAE